MVIMVENHAFAIGIFSEPADARYIIDRSPSMPKTIETTFIKSSTGGGALMGYCRKKCTLASMQLESPSTTRLPDVILLME